MKKYYTSLPTINPSEIARKGEEIYRQKSEDLEKKYLGKYMAIEVESGKYFLGETQIDAWNKAKMKFPKKIFYFKKIGSPGVVRVSTSTLTASSDALAGTALFSDYEVHFNFAKQKIFLEKVK